MIGMRKAQTVTLPSDQSNMAWRGSSARYMVVVFHHNGKPRKMTMAQKEEMTSRRVVMLFDVSGGGD